MSELELHLVPVAPGQRREAFLKTLQVVAHFYGVPAVVDLPGRGALAKAVPAHPSHYQTRLRSGRFTAQHPGNQTPRDAAGRYRQRLTAAERQAAVNEAGTLQAQFADRMQDHLSDRLAGSLTPEKFLERTERDIRLFYAEMYRRGRQAVGDPAILSTPQDAAALNRLVKDELDYLRAFSADITAQRGTWPYPRRMAAYANAAWEALWMGFILGDQRAGREIRWVFGPTDEHCADCTRFVAMGWTAAPEFTREVLAKGFAPRSGSLACLGIHCLCRLEEQLGGVPQPALHYPPGQ